VQSLLNPFVYLGNIGKGNSNTDNKYGPCKTCPLLLLTGVLRSPQSDQEGNKLQRPNSNFCKPLKYNSEGCPPKRVSAAAMTPVSDEKWRPFNRVFQSGQAKNLSTPLYMGSRCTARGFKSAVK